MFKCYLPGKTASLKLYVIEKRAKPLIDLQDSLSLEVTPMVCPPRSLPVTLHDKVKLELYSMVTKEVSYP